MEGQGTTGAPFDEVAKVASEWVFDFLFAGLCYYFKEDRTEDFQRTGKALEVILEGMPVLDPDRNKAVYIAQFLTCVSEGKSLDTQFELDERVTPLESAAMFLDEIEEEKENLKNLIKDIKCIVKVQAVAICMEKGRFKMSSEVLDRLFPESESNKYLKMKLAMIVGKKDPYHAFLENFSYTKMLTKIKVYIELILQERSPAFLLKVATKVVAAKAEKMVGNQTEKKDANLLNNERLKSDAVSLSSESTVGFHQMTQTTESTREDDSPSSTNARSAVQEHMSDINHNEIAVDGNTEEAKVDANACSERCQRRLFSFELQTPWEPDKQTTGNTLIGRVKLGKRNRENQETLKSVKTGLSPVSAAPKKRQHWTWEEDELLKKGVKKYGVGNWRKILVHFEFNNRTGVMLKDRWRTMKKLNIVGSENELV
ncbi:telomeric repeat-binding factor 1 [Spea bombifrons]|uniref:telomeric repeat-binding factor 1 n=1 Tax=Spea bombifrons TaxID=233779 RepID=UPI00234B0941|nr:telomeric repeat-binding factor 1 [Spea bombifrons]